MAQARGAAPWGNRNGYGALKLAILAGGRGSRFGAVSAEVPKPLIPVCGQPIIYRVMDHAAGQGVDDFVIAGGYRVEDLANYFAGRRPDTDNVRVLLRDTRAAPPHRYDRGWSVSVLDTGPDTGKTERVLRLRPHLKDGTFLLAYCDGLSDIDFADMLRFHRAQGKVMTLAAVHGRERFGLLDLAGDRVAALREKPLDADRWINGGVFVLEPEIFDMIDDPSEGWETGVIQRLIARGQAAAYRHDGFWQCMDTPADRVVLEDILMSADTTPAQRTAKS